MTLGIPRSVSKLEDKVKLEGRSQSLEPGGLDGYGPSGSANSCLIICTVRFSIPEGLAASSASNFSSSSISKILRFIVRVSFSRYIFFCFRRRTTRSFTSSNSASVRRCWAEMTRSCLDETLRTLQLERFFRTYSTQCEESRGDTSYIGNPNRAQ